MSKYKLIREYPGSKTIGYEVSFTGRGYSHKSKCDYYPKYTIETNPEFWEKVVEVIKLDPSIKVGNKIYRIWPSGKKTLGLACGYTNTFDYMNTKLEVTHFWSLETYNKEGGVTTNNGFGLGNYAYEKVEDKEYEILSFKDNEGKIWKADTQLKDCWCCHNEIIPFYQEKQLLVFKGFDIYSIERLSDGEVFTVGNKLVLSKYMLGEKFLSIDKIYFNEHDQLSFSTIRSQAPKAFVFGISDLNYKRYKKPLFTTKDGVDIYKGDKYWFYWKEKAATNQKPLKVYGPFIEYELNEGISNSPEAIFFSSQLKAEQHLNKNYKIKVEDGYVSKTETIYGINCFWEGFFEIGFHINSFMNKNKKFFKSKEKRDKYISENKPMYSKKDMLSFAIDITAYNINGNTFISILNNWLKENDRN